MHTFQISISFQSFFEVLLYTKFYKGIYITFGINVNVIYRTVSYIAAAVVLPWIIALGFFVPMNNNVYLYSAALLIHKVFVFVFCVCCFLL
jgi:hypothetical protein